MVHISVQLSTTAFSMLSKVWVQLLLCVCVCVCTRCVRARVRACVCVVSVIVKRPVLLPSVVDGCSRNPL